MLYTHMDESKDTIEKDLLNRSAVCAKSFSFKVSSLEKGKMDLMDIW